MVACKAACTRNGIGHALLFERRDTRGSETMLSAKDEDVSPASGEVEDKHSWQVEHDAWRSGPAGIATRPTER